MRVLKSTTAVMVALVALCLGACSSPKNIAYLQDTAVGVSQPISQQPNIVARPGDRIAIQDGLHVRPHHATAQH